MVGRSIKIGNEVQSMYEALSKERTLGRNHKCILAVVETEDNATLLDKKLHPPWWKKTIFWKNNKKGFPVNVTRAKHLQHTIDEVEHSLSGLKNVELFMLVHPGVRRMSFHVAGDYIGTITVMRHNVGPTMDENLIISGKSTFAGTRLDDWKANRNKNLYLGKDGICIRADPTTSSIWAEATSRQWENLPQYKSEELRNVLNETTRPGSKGDWWETWKGPVAVILGTVAGTAKLAAGLKASAGGMYIKHTASSALFTHTLEAGAIGGKLTAIATAAGPALLVGVGVAAAVYIPWKKFFEWLGGFLHQVFEACQGIWRWFTSWFARFREWLRKTFTDLPRCRQSR